MRNDDVTTIAPSTLFIGDAERHEFREAAAMLRFGGARIEQDLPAALKIIHEGFTPSLIFVGQPWPDGCSANDVDTLRRAAPLARIVRLLGTWMEGELRTGHPWPASLRRYWHQVEPAIAVQDWWLRVEESLLRPVTASEDEHLLWRCSGVTQSTYDKPVRIVIYARNRESAESLAHLCARHGWQADWQCDVGSSAIAEADVVLFDAICGDDAELCAVSSVKAALSRTPIFAILGFPRTDDISRFRAAGASAVISKPFLADDLIWQIEQCLAQAAAPAN